MIMNIKKLFLPITIGIILLFSGCRNNEIKKDAIQIGDAMCRNIEIMNKIRANDPKDTAAARKLNREAKMLQTEMTILYKEFGDKYGAKTKNAEFNKKFAQELRKAMLDCPYLSKEDREQFEREIKE
jgi:hypothetical protein